MSVAGVATNKEAAASLFLSTKTVEFHLTNAYRKLGVRSRAELVRRVEGLS
jgi:DNA-binding CsgD family transcriptional regulator